MAKNIVYVSPNLSTPGMYCNDVADAVSECHDSSENWQHCKTQDRTSSAAPLAPDNCAVTLEAAPPCCNK